MTRLLALSLVLTCWLPGAAHASPLFELLGDNYGLGGFNARVVGTDASAAYFNPALLARAEEGLKVGFTLLHDNIGIQLKARPGLFPCSAPNGLCSHDIPDGAQSYLNGDGTALDSVFLPTPWLESGKDNAAGSTERLEARPRGGGYDAGTLTPYISAGLVIRLLKQYAVFGMNVLFPTDEFTRAQAFYVDEREQAFTNSLQPELYSDRLKAPSLAFALGSQVHERVALGLSVTLKLINGAAAPVYVPDPNELGNVELSSDVSVDIGLSPHGGIWVEPIDGWTLAATVHSPQKLEVTAEYSFQLRSGLADASTLQFTHGFLPWKAGFGTAYELPLKSASRVSVVASAEFTRWSQYINRQAEEPTPFYEWDDTVSGSAGVRYGIGDFDAALDGTFVPSPVPDQTGRTNYVDNDRIGVSLAGEQRFKIFESQNIAIGAQIQLHRLLERSVDKITPHENTPDGELPYMVQDTIPDDAIDGARGDRPAEGRIGLQTNNPGFPGYGSEGWITAGSLYVNVGF